MNILDLKTKADTLRRELKRTNKLLTKEVKAYVKNTPLDVLIKLYKRAIIRKKAFPFLYDISDRELNYILDSYETVDNFLLKDIWNRLPKNVQRSVIRVYILNRMVK